MPGNDEYEKKILHYAVILALFVEDKNESTRAQSKAKICSWCPKCLTKDKFRVVSYRFWLSNFFWSGFEYLKIDFILLLTFANLFFSKNNLVTHKIVVKSATAIDVSVMDFKRTVTCLEVRVSELWSQSSLLIGEQRELALSQLCMTTLKSSFTVSEAKAHKLLRRWGLSRRLGDDTL